MSTFYPTYPVGSVGYNLMLMRGVWHDHIELYHLDGTPLNSDDDLGAGTPGPSPFDNVAYVDFDGINFKVTNVHFRGRKPAAKTFSAKMEDGILVFDELGPGAFKNVGISGGPGIMTFNAIGLGEHTNTYMEPDFIMLTGPGQRVRHTILYKDGQALRTLTAKGNRIAPTCDKRVDIDPRGIDGPVHEETFVSPMWQHLVDA